jgi:hypothetical protein
MLARRRQGQHLGITGFIDDIGRAWATAMTEPEGGAKVVELFRLQTARQVASNQTTVHSNSDLQTLVWLGRVDEAISLCRLRSQPDDKYAGLRSIIVALNVSAESEAAPALHHAVWTDKWESQLLKVSELAARAIRGDAERTKALGEVAAAYERIGDPRADELFEEAKEIALNRYFFEDVAMSPIEGGKVGVWAVRDLAEVLIRAKRYELAEALASNVLGSDSLFDELFRTAAAALAKAGDFIEAERVARGIRDAGKRAEALADIGSVLARENQFEEAERIARSIESGHQQIRALCSVAAGLARAKEERGTKLFEEVEQAISKVGGTDQSKLTFILSMALAEAARYGDAEKLIRTISDIETRAEALIVLAQALAQYSDAQAAPVFDEALTVIRTIEGESRRADMAGALIEALVQARAFAKAEEISCSLLPEGWDRAEALRKIAAGLAGFRDSDTNHAIDTAWHAAQAVKDPRLRALSLFELALLIGRSGDRRMQQLLTEARHALNEIADEQTRLDELSSMANALARKGLDCARDILEQVIVARRELASGKGPDLKQIATLLIQANCYREAEQIARLIQSPESRAEVLRTLGKALAAMQDARANPALVEALQATATIPNPADRAQELCMVVEILARWKAPQTSHTLNSALTEVRLLQDPYGRASELCSLAFSAAKAGLDQSHAIFDEAIAIGKTIASKEHQALALKEICEALASCGYYAKSEQVGHEIANDQLRSTALATLALGLAQDGHLSEADRVANAIHDFAERARTLAGVSSALAQRGDTTAGAWLDRALELAQSVGNPQARARLFSDLGWHLAQSGDERSGQIFGAALTAADGIGDPEARAEELIHLGWTLSHTDDNRAGLAFDHARSAVDAIEGELQGAFQLSMKGRMLCYLASALSLSGRFAEASNVAYAIDDEAWRASALRELAATLAEKNKLEAADPVFEEAERQLKTVQHHLSWQSGARDLVIALANAGRYLKVLDFLKSADLDSFLEMVLSIIPGLERLNPGITLNLVREVSGVAGWTRPPWRRVHKVLINRQTAC